MLLKSCGRCGSLVFYGTKYCKVCEPIVEAEIRERQLESKRASDRRYNQKRDPKYIRFYNSIEWRTLAAKYSQDKGYRCEECDRIATEVHHRKAIQTPEGWNRRLDYDNLELLCKGCHNERHERFLRRKKYIDETQKKNVRQ